MVNVVAHRGASGTHPENTASAFLEAIRLGVEAIELDVHLTRDERLNVCHDPSVDRTSNGSGLVADLDLNQIKQLDAGSWFAPRFAGEHFLVLEEVLEFMPETMTLNVHIKANDHDRKRVTELTVCLLQERQLLRTAFVTSDDQTLAVARRVEPDLQICNLSTRPTETYIARSRDIDCRILQPSNRNTSEELVREAHEHGMEVNPFYADDEKEMQRLIACGVDGILTNYPHRLLQVRETRFSDA